MNNKRSNQYVVYDKEENLIMVGKMKKPPAQNRQIAEEK